MTTDRMIKLLELDLEYLNKTIDKFDNQRFTIRGWSVTAAGTLLALAIGQKNPAMSIIGLFLVTFLAYLEVIYMELQVRVQDRCTEVCAQLLRVSQDLANADEIYQFGVRAALGTEPFRWNRIPKLLHFRPELYIFYLGLMVAMIASSVVIWSVG